jgi:hypothetical protein
VPLFWLTYRHSDGRTAGVVVIESRGLLHARLKASLAGADREMEFASGHQLDPLGGEQIPANMIGRFLDDGDLRKLHGMLILEAEKPDLEDYEWPEPADGDEYDDPLFDSSRDYVEQIDRCKEYQDKPTTGSTRRNIGVTLAPIVAEIQQAVGADKWSAIARELNNPRRQDGNRRRMGSGGYQTVVLKRAA